MNVPAAGTPVLECEHLDVRFGTRESTLHVVRDLCLRVERGECVGIVGESGSGKSQACLAIAGLLADNGRASGRVRLEGEDILNAPRARLDRVRGARLGMVFQDPMSSLTPFLRIGDQLREPLRHHRGLSDSEARARVLEALELVRIPDAKRRYAQYPHELSGGMRQRVMIAQAMLCRPALLIADEPTTALDVTVQAQILEILGGLRRHTESAIVLITHDLGVVAEVCDRVIVMYGGRIVEDAPVDQLFQTPAHPYTRALLESVLTLEQDPRLDLGTIAGAPPAPDALARGCAFAPRCPRRLERCDHESPTLVPHPAGRRVSCHLAATMAAA